MTIEQQRRPSAYDFWGTSLPRMVDVVSTLVEGHWLTIALSSLEAEKRREELEEKMRHDRLLVAAVLALLGISDESLSADAEGHLLKAFAARVARGFAEAENQAASPAEVIGAVLNEMVRLMETTTAQTREASYEALLE